MQEKNNDLLSTNYIRMGYWAAIACGVGAIAYGIISIIVAITDSSALTFTTYEQYLAAYNPLPTYAILTPPFLVALIFPVLITAIYAIAPDERKPYALLALLFAGIYTATLGLGYWLQLSFVPQSILEGNTAGLQLWILWHPRSFFWGIESFGYFMMGLSCFFAAYSFKAGILSRPVKLGLILMAPLGVCYMANMALGIWPLASVTPLLLLFGWVILFGFVALSLARVFKQLQNSTEQEPGQKSG